MTREEYEAIHGSLVFAETVMESPEATIRPTVLSGGADTRPEPDRIFIGSDSLPQIQVGEAGELGVELQFGETLGEGGMGLVRSARQVPIGRNVAVKSVRDEFEGDMGAASALVREAVATGRLEHPNVVPIYSVGRDSDGRPVIVMKRIEGASWLDYIKHPDRVPSSDPLGWHLEIFRDVCTATHFAHSRGVIHRDIKPENVMVGSFGEVYLVDWGLAVRLEGDPTGALPSIADIDQLAGTPAYMAPEMASGDFASLGAPTDIYLLGAVLHEIVMGTPPHTGSTIFQVMFAAFQSKPFDYPESVPGHLASICHRAMAREPENRFASALELREAVTTFISHRAAEELGREAAEQLTELRQVIADDSDIDEERRVLVYRLWGAARFGFERSLNSWPENQAAKDGLALGIITMIDWELGHGSVHTARALLADLEEPPDDVVKRIEDVESRLGEEQAELEELREFRDQRDANAGAGSRGVIVGVLVVIGVVLPAIAVWQGWVVLSDPLTFWLVALIAGGGSILGMAAGWRGMLPIQVERTESNRQALAFGYIACVYLMVFRGAALLAGTGVPVAAGLELVGFSAMTLVTGSTYDRRLFGMSPIYVAGGLVILAFQEWGVAMYAVTHGLAMSYISVRWSRAAKQS